MRYVNSHLIAILLSNKLPIYEKVKSVLLLYWLFISTLIDSVIGLITLGFIVTDLELNAMRYQLDNGFYLFTKYGFNNE